MPRLKALTTSGAAGRQLLEDTLAALAAEGYTRSGVSEGGEWSALISAGRTGSLFDEKRVTVVEGAEFLGPFPDALEPFLEEEGAAEVILLVYESAPTKLFAPEIKKKVGFLRPETTSLAPWERKGWLMKVAKEMDVHMSDDGAAFLAEMLDDPGELRSEVGKLGRYAAGEVVTGDMVKSLSFDEGKSRMLSFLDAFCAGRAGEIFSCLEHLKKEDSVLPLVTALYNRIRPALYLELFPERGGDWVRLVLQIKEYPLKMSREALRHYPARALADLAAGLIALSWKEKTSTAEGWFGFEALLARCMGSAGNT
ncbi:MAG: hypothetical protein KA342_00900 [Aminivibrio sp.]|nr:hypothetical protein [Aminivibrio sp.]